MLKFLEIITLTNLICLILPFDGKPKKLITVTAFFVLTVCLFFFLFLNQISVFDFTRIFFAQNEIFYFLIPLNFSLNNLSLIFCFLTSLLFLLVLLMTYKSPNFNSPNFYILIWFLNFSLLHCFSSSNLILFFFFFELTLLPMFLLILLWGSRQRKVHAAYVFFFYTAFGSLFLLLGIFYYYFLTNTFEFNNLNYIEMPEYYQTYLFFFFFLGFSTKIPIVPLHTWLPEAHVEAPTVGSVILAGLLLKIGTFGMLKFMLPMLNLSITTFRPFIFLLGFISIYHASLIALRQFDLKKLIAYSSVAHMGFVVLGLFSADIYGFTGSVFIMFSHGLVASALFFLIGVLYERYKSKNILHYGGLASLMPVFSIFLFLLILANISFPGTSNFIGESLILLGITQNNVLLSLLTTFSIILTAAYSIWAFNRVCFGTLSAHISGFSDLNKIETYIILIFCLFCIILGFIPRPILNHLELFSFIIIKN